MINSEKHNHIITELLTVIWFNTENTTIWSFFEAIFEVSNILHETGNYSNDTIRWPQSNSDDKKNLDQTFDVISSKRFSEKGYQPNVNGG
jgi:hypothetical protein